MEEKPFHFYLSYITIREVWGMTKGYFGAWLFLSIIFILFGAIFELGVEVSKETVSNFGLTNLPKWVGPVAIFSGVLWFNKGNEIKIKFPELNFLSWLILTIFIVIIVFILSYFPFWVGLPFYLAIVVGCVVLDMLVEQGKKNYKKLKEH